MNSLRAPGRVAIAAFIFASGAAAGEQEAAPANRFEKDGVVVEFSAQPRTGTRAELMDGDMAEIRFRITDSSGQPMKDSV